mmetsp:Transcript_24451/g.28169  ORF Transcript_24451/g.28169 Transcript_24451/m.28169 type:complete len:400 (-) Transcript_24451:237-1436(-)
MAPIESDLDHNNSSPQNNASPCLQLNEATSSKVNLTSVTSMCLPFVTLTKESKTPSGLDLISSDLERLHRLYGASLIQQSTHLLRLPISCYATSTSLFHNFFHRNSLKQYDAWSVAMGCVLLGSKIEEHVTKVRHIIIVFVHLYRRRRFGLKFGRLPRWAGKGSSSDQVPLEGNRNESSVSHLLSSTEKEQLLKKYIPSLSKYDDLFKIHFDTISKIETVILRSLGFTIYWMPASHPHTFILYFAKVLELDCVECGKNDENDGGTDSSENVIQLAWNYCNDSCLLDLCCQYEAQIVACAAIYLSCQVCNISLPSLWYKVFVSTLTEQDLSNVCNAILAVSDEDVVDEPLRKFIASLIVTETGEPNEMIHEGSFNDPDSFVWCLMDTKDEAAMKEMNAVK